MGTQKDLQAWQLSMDLVENIYQITAKFPKDELYNLISQMRRSAISVPSNIAEGAARNTKKEYIQFLYISLGSLSELETQLELAKRLRLMDDTEISGKIEKIRRMLLNLVKYLKVGKCSNVSALERSVSNSISNTLTLEHSNTPT
jgi:four helix bundle protein